MHNRTCTIDGCARPHNAHGWCLAHYKRWQRWGNPEGSRPVKTECSVPDCERPWRTREWCFMHYQRLMRHGDVNYTPPPRGCMVDGCTKPHWSGGLCHKHLARQKRHGSPTARLRGEVVNGLRVCTVCRVDKPLSEYYRGRAGRCAECRAAYSALPERRQQRRAWAKANPDYMRDAIRRSSHRRRALIANTQRDQITRAQLSARMQVFGNRCWMCGGSFDHIDHVKPLSKGGPHILANLRPSCARCNMSKSDRWEGVEGIASFMKH